MLAVRIPFSQKIINTTGNSTFYLVEKKNKYILHVEIELDSHLLESVDDQEEVTDPAIKANKRDARVGVILSDSTKISKLEISVIDPAGGSSLFKMEGTIDTKVPGTGDGLLMNEEVIMFPDTL
jgi:hypothetical protein